MLSALRRGEVREIGRSAGGRPLWAVAYGQKEPIARTANHSSALAAKQPEAFFGAERRKKQVLLIISAIHGGEMESIAGVHNLCSVLETGTDLKGKAWPGLTAAAEQLRLIIVPCLNPDGRARIPSDDPTTWTEDQQEKYRHGLSPDGSHIGWPACKVPHPRRPAEQAFLGSCFGSCAT
jgi:zinc carboxypeptidase